MASITDSSISIGGGIVTQVFSAGGTFLHGKRATTSSRIRIRLPFSFPRPPKAARRNVRLAVPAGSGERGRHQRPAPGVRATFFSALQNASCLGAIEVLTRWRKYDAKSGVLGAPVDETVAMRSIVPAFDLIPSDYQVAWEDLGNGQVAVTLSGDPGWVMPGTRVRLGDTILGEGSPAFLLEFHPAVSRPGRVACSLPRQARHQGRNRDRHHLPVRQIHALAGRLRPVVGWPDFRHHDAGAGFAPAVAGNSGPPKCRFCVA